MTTISMDKAPAELRKLVARVLAGEEIVLTQNDKPVARLEPVIAPDNPRGYGVPAEAAILTEAALAEDWDRPEEDEAWSHLRPAP